MANDQSVDHVNLNLLLEESRRRNNQGTFDSSCIEAVLGLRMQLMEPQLAFIRDTSRFKAAKCTRRAGKTFVARQIMGEAAIAYPGETICYIALTKETAREIMFDPFMEWCRQARIDAHFNRQQLRITFPNGSKILMHGAEKPKEIEKLRGARYCLAVIDESSLYGKHMEELVRAVITPALIDLKGAMVLLGTPGQLADGFFYRVTTHDKREKHWSVHCWTLGTNVHLDEAERNVNHICDTLFNGDRADPTFRREYLGEWIADVGMLVYAYNPSLNAWDGELPQGHDWLYGLGVDIGSTDGTTYAVVAFSSTSENLYLIEERKIQGEKGLHLSVSDIAVQLKDLYKKYTFCRVVADTGSLSAVIVTELNQRWGFNIASAEKQHKDAYIEIINSDFRLGRIKMRHDGPTAREMSQHIWDNRLTSTGKRREKPGRPNDHCDAFLYTYRDSKHWAGRDPVVALKPLDISMEEWHERLRREKYFKGREKEDQGSAWAYYY